MSGSNIVDLAQTTQLANGDLFVRRPRGHTRADTIQTDGLAPAPAPTDVQAERHAAEQRGLRSARELTAGDVVEQAVQDAKRTIGGS